MGKELEVITLGDKEYFILNEVRRNGTTYIYLSNVEDKNYTYEELNNKSIDELEIIKNEAYDDFVETLELDIHDYERAIDLAPSIKPFRHTYLHEKKYRVRAKELLKEDETLQRIFRN